MLVFLDIETTGLEKEDKLVSIGIIIVDGEEITSIYEELNEGKKILAEASSINHITNEMLKDKPKFKESKIYTYLQNNNNENTTLIAHNTKFALEKLSAAGLQYRGGVIDTLRVTKHLVSETEHFSLQFLRYELKLYKDEKKSALKCGIKGELVAHHALYDALVVKNLYEYLLEMSSHGKMMELSFKYVLMDKLDFGKHKGKYIEEIIMNDRAYLQWMLDNIMDLDEDLRYSITYYLQEQS